jgi:hypothetical protein
MLVLVQKVNDLGEIQALRVMFPRNYQLSDVTVIPEQL